jgi:dihydroxyacid dehydratase/phosphogluconate dehydratase
MKSNGMVFVKPCDKSISGAYVAAVIANLLKGKKTS